MPGDPKECRQHALNCVHPAKGATTPEQRDHFAKLARTWIKLAEELEQAEALLAVIEEDELNQTDRLKKGPRTSKERGLKVEKERQLTCQRKLRLSQGELSDKDKRLLMLEAL